MGQANFRVVLTGDVVDNFELDEVVQTASKLFRCNEQKARQLLGKKPTPLKRLMDQETADRYRDRLIKSGIDCHVQALEATAPAQNNDPALEQPNKPAKQPANSNMGLELSDPDPATPQSHSSIESSLSLVADETPASEPATAKPSLELTGATTAGLSLQASHDAPTASSPAPMTPSNPAGFVCPKCATPQPSPQGQGAECIHCGVIFSKLQQNPAQPAVTSNSDDVSQDEELDEWDELSLFVGDNFDSYRMKFREIKQNDDKFQIQFHWPAFLVPIPWMLHRKLYLWALGFIALTVALPIHGSWALGIIVGLSANYVYYRHAKKRIENITSSGEDRRDEIIMAGGTNSLFVTIGLTLAAGLLLFALFYNFILRPALNESFDATEADQAFIEDIRSPQEQTTKVQMVTLKNAIVVAKKLSSFAGQDFSMPTNSEQLRRDFALPTDQYTDAWDNPIEYALVEQTMIFSSAGPDGAWDTEDDIVLEVKE